MPSTIGEQAQRTEAAPDPRGYICTFLDGAPVPSLFQDVEATAHRTPDWSAAKPRHANPDTGDVFAVLARDCQIAFVRRDQLPAAGEQRIDLTRAPVLDIRLVNVPAEIREKLVVQLQVSHGQLSAAENAALVFFGTLAPVVMNGDRALVELSLPMPGHAVVHAKSRRSHTSYPTPKVPFEPVSQVIEIDLSVLTPALSLATLDLTLRFPHAHPAGEFVVSLRDADGSTLTFQRGSRDRERELRFQFADLPRSVVVPVLAMRHGVVPRLLLDPIDTTTTEGEVVRDVVAESAIDVQLIGRDGIAADAVSVLLRDEAGAIVVAPWPRGNEYRIAHLPAMTCYVQAVAYDARRCSPVARLILGTGEAHAIALQLLPAAKVDVAPGRFGAAIRFLDVHYPEHGDGRVFLDPKRTTTAWLPIGTPRVEWTGGWRLLRVDEGVVNSWAP